MNNGDLPAAPILGDTEAFVLFLDKIKGGNNYGLTKRETFAMAAMQGILSNPYLMEALINRCQGVDTSKLNKEVVRIAYLHADIALEGQQPSTESE